MVGIFPGDQYNNEEKIWCRWQSAKRAVSILSDESAGKKTNETAHVPMITMPIKVE